jgi:hypothetical protein
MAERHRERALHFVIPGVYSKRGEKLKRKTKGKSHSTTTLLSVFWGVGELGKFFVL